MRGDAGDGGAAAAIPSHRLRSHLLTEPASTVGGAATHMLAVQAQEFWSGRWAVAVRTVGELALSAVDAAFEDGTLVRSWTQRGTLHIVRSTHLAALLAATADRQERAAAGILRGLAIDGAVLATAERAARQALRGANRLTRDEFADVLRGAGIDTERSRGNHILSSLAVRGVLAFGPVVPRESGVTRDQFLVAVDDLPSAGTPDDPLADMFAGYIRSHGPARITDFGWWAGLPIGTSRRAAEAARDRVVEIEVGLFVARTSVPGPSESGEDVVALPAFDEYYLSYADRTIVCEPELAARIGPTLNGQVAPILVSGGRVIGTWRHSVATGRHHLPPEPVLVTDDGVSSSAIDASLARVSRFLAS
ncbi:winged helix DNA-binding domain-containing protein [Microbacterium sp. cf332]|uniref:winged helix DNA-binding domain-containing protein n=1 Tax=Microbacterium sp. cf332 TaxID=1761804 RepID=UPI000885688D|nr:winged helix DNA-binding domain-containing protein [Microbacterium sp. cf332]SDQ77518.1 Winged helix DNA-binding domain-containing protein [Microbacterium sp. cf332]